MFGFGKKARDERELRQLIEKLSPHTEIMINELFKFPALKDRDALREICKRTSTCIILREQNDPHSNMILEKIAEDATKDREEAWSKVKKLDQEYDLNSSASDGLAITGFVEIFVQCILFRFGKDLSIETLNKLDGWLLDNLGEEECLFIMKNQMQKLNEFRDG